MPRRALCFTVRLHQLLAVKVQLSSDGTFSVLLILVMLDVDKVKEESLVGGWTSGGGGGNFLKGCNLAPPPPAIRPTWGCQHAPRNCPGTFAFLSPASPSEPMAGEQKPERDRPLPRNYADLL